jgi:hypothetical protein
MPVTPAKAGVIKLRARTGMIVSVFAQRHTSCAGMTMPLDHLLL